jgi:hypothetical protein
MPHKARTNPENSEFRKAELTARRDSRSHPSRKTWLKLLVQLMIKRAQQNYMRSQELERLDVRRLPTLGSLDYVELHCLTLLEALETV